LLIWFAISGLVDFEVFLRCANPTWKPNKKIRINKVNRNWYFIFYKGKTTKYLWFIEYYFKVIFFNKPLLPSNFAAIFEILKKINLFGYEKKSTCSRICYVVF
jgi:hypothetical protein